MQTYENQILSPRKQNQAIQINKYKIYFLLGHTRIVAHCLFTKLPRIYSDSQASNKYIVQLIHIQNVFRNFFKFSP